MARTTDNARRAPALTCTVTLAASATTDGMEATVQVKDSRGANVAGPHIVEVWISEAATGLGLTADSYSGTVTAPSVGAIHTALTAKKHFICATTAAGALTLLAVDSANPTDQYVCARVAGESSFTVSAASGTSWEGAA